ncbi:MAG: hypothetical protein ACPLPS_08865 [bacterium]
MRERLFSLLAFGTIILLLAGCGGGGGPQPPSPPTIRKADRQWTGTADNLSQEVQLRWEQVQGASGYNVYRKVEDEQKYTKIASVQMSQSSYFDNINEANFSKKISYYVTAIGPGGESLPSNTVETSPPSLDAPKNLKAERYWQGTADNLSQEVKLTWENWRTTKSVTYYKVYRNDEPVWQTQSTSYTDKVPQELWGQKITYKVATYIEGMLEASAEKVVDPPALSAPQNLTADRHWLGTATNLYQETVLNWKHWRKRQSAATTYRVYRNGQLIADNLQVTTYTDKQIPQDLFSKSIVYKVATCVQGYGEETTEITVPPPPLSSPQNLNTDRHWTGSGDNVSQVTILSWGHWRNRQVASSYKIYRNDELLTTTQQTTYTDQVPPNLWSQNITYKVATYIEGFNEATAEKTTSPPPLSTPQNLTADRHWAGTSPNYYQETKLSWSSVVGATSYNVYIQAEGQDIVKIAEKVKDTQYTHQIPSDLWTKNIDYFVSAVNETANMEGDKTQVHTDANLAGPPPGPLSKAKK